MLDASHYLCLALLYTTCVDVTASDVAPNVLNTTPEALEHAERRLRVDTDGGIVLNQAITVAGQDFYQYFSAAWRDKDGSERYTLAIRERPSVRWGSEIWVEYGQRRLYYAYLPPARASIHAMSENAAEIAFQAAVQADLQRLLTNDSDLGADEF
jgi:curli production assembly/transport component CsgE